MHEDCMKYAERISEFLDGELDEEIFAEIRSHLEVCPECRHCVESLRKTTDLLKRTPRDSVPADVRKRLRTALKACLDRGGKSGLP